MTGGRLVLLDCALPGGGWSGLFQLFRENSLTRELFEALHHITVLQSALDVVRADPGGVILVVGPGFFGKDEGLKQALKKSFTDAGLPHDKMVFAHRDDPALPLLCEYEGAFSMDVTGMAFKAAGWQSL